MHCTTQPLTACLRPLEAEFRLISLARALLTMPRKVNDAVNLLPWH